MFINKQYIKIISDIVKNNSMTKLELAHELKVNYSTLYKILDPHNEAPLRMKTKKNILHFIQRYRDIYGTE